MAKSVRALALNSQKCRSSRFARSKIWGALALDVQKCGSSRKTLSSSHLKRYEKKTQRVTGRHEL